VFPEGSTIRPGLDALLAPLDRVVSIDHWRHTAAFHPPRTWQDRPWRRSTDGIRSAPAASAISAPIFKRVGGAWVAGIPVVRWTRKIAQDGDQDVYLAPSLDCYPLKTYATIRNRC